MRLRAHHVLCVLTYAGTGYSERFCANMDRVIARLNAGAAIVLKDGPDDICAPLVAAGPAHCRRYRVHVRDRRARAVLATLMGRRGPASGRLRLSPRRVARLRRAFGRGRARAACRGCPWSALCGRIAASGFVDTRLLPRHGQAASMAPAIRPQRVAALANRRRGRY
ncbi:MAG: DUF1284 domain-containing protein [Rhodospirillales bacterium]|nr:MAG: DUF1284 domain-containing protein [Rhodospirillales bacterium]